ncbi:MAG: DNA repair protein RecN [Pseudomonadota bacterium]|nr:DNA repair protein RecN [Pseudomonadota bacterium]
MLTSLNLNNFALVEQLDLDIASGFTVLTGETGAGKSILLDALSACLGERVDAQSVRFGTDKADLTATFELSQADDAEQWLKARELHDPQDTELRLRRVIQHNGRSKAWINGRPASLADLRELGQCLVQLNSQHSQQQLLQSNYAREWLDRLAQLEPQAISVRQHYHDWQTLLRQQQHIERAQAQRLAREQQLSQQLEELDSIVGLEYDLLEQAHDRLSHFDQMMQDTAAMLDGLDESENNLVQQLSSLLRRAEAQASRDPALASTYDLMHSAHALLQDAVSGLRQFAQAQELDPAQLEQLDQQLGEFHRLARKYRVQPTELAAQQRDWQAELDQLAQLPDPEQLAAQVLSAEATFQQVAQALDHTRQAIAPTLAEQLAEQVRPLALPEARFEFQFKPLTQPSAQGLSDIELLFSANRGMPLQPLAKVASGGELSRIALVMQVMNAEYIAAPTLVFDEVDVGISGGTAEIVGRLLRKLGQQVQIICITHQPQVAAQGHQHLLVEKQQGEQTASHLRVLNHEQRVLELARMSGGVEINQSTLNHARHLLAQSTTAPEST